MTNETGFEEGFYYLQSRSEVTPVLVHGYFCTDAGGEFVFGFNIHDGGGLVLLKDLTEETTVTPVFISQTDNEVVLQGVESLKDLTEVQCNDGNWNYDSYMHGMANGMILALSMFEAGEVEFLDAPDEWICDTPNTDKPEVASADNTASKD